MSEFEVVGMNPAIFDKYPRVVPTNRGVRGSQACRQWTSLHVQFGYLSRIITHFDGSACPAGNRRISQRADSELSDHGTEIQEMI
jgi:hypothetical protein